MYNQPFYFEEGKTEIKNKKIIIFCIIIAIITIGIIVFTGILAYKMINNKKDNLGLEQLSGENTIGMEENSTEVKEEENIAEVEESPEPENTPTTKQTSKFPKHDYNAALESQLPQYSEEIAKKVVNVYFEKSKKIYLTFDDGQIGRASCRERV